MRVTRGVGVALDLLTKKLERKSRVDNIMTIVHRYPEILSSHEFICL
jgi:hypothetical protein